LLLDLIIKILTTESFKKKKKKEGKGEEMEGFLKVFLYKIKNSTSFFSCLRAIIVLFWKNHFLFQNMEERRELFIDCISSPSASPALFSDLSMALYL